MKKKLLQDESWLEGAEKYWQKMDALYAGIITASEQNKRREWRRLRRQLFYLIRKAMQGAKYQGRLIRALGDTTLNINQAINALLKGYAVSKRERDYYNCLLTAESLAYHFVEWRFDSQKARFWIKQTRVHLKNFKAVDITRNIHRLERILRERLKLATHANLPRR